MGMSIDEAKMQLSMQKFYVLGKDYEAVQVAIDTMRNYQQIQEWFKSYWGIQEQDIMDAIHGKSYDNRWHSVINEKDFEMLVLSQTDKEPTVEAIPKDQYEARLKDDMVAMLTEIQLEIEELRLDRPLMSRGYECYGFEDKTPKEIRQECSDIIQQKINELKENEDE